VSTTALKETAQPVDDQDNGLAAANLFSSRPRAGGASREDTRDGGSPLQAFGNVEAVDAVKARGWSN
jgi:hypothetical protein